MMLLTVSFDPYVSISFGYKKNSSGVVSGKEGGYSIRHPFALRNCKTANAKWGEASLLGLSKSCAFGNKVVRMVMSSKKFIAFSENKVQESDFQ